MASEWSIGTIWSEETESGLVLHIRVGAGADVMLTLLHSPSCGPMPRTPYL